MEREINMTGSDREEYGSCRLCFYWQRDHIDKPSMGYCEYLPPVLNVSTGTFDQPYVGENDWCGQFRYGARNV